MVGKYPHDHSWKSVNGTLKEIRRLQADRRHREARGAFFVEGIRDFVQVVDQHLDIEVIVFSEKLLIHPLARKLVRRSRRSGIPTINIPPGTFRTFSKTKRASGVSAILRQRWTPLDAISPNAGLCWVILGLVRNPGNLGTLIRTSEAVGGSGFILLDDAVDMYDPGTVRASTGAHFRQRYVRTYAQALSSWLQRNHSRVVGATPDGDACYHHVIYPEKTLLFLGEERKGLTAKQRSMCNHLVRIPMVGQVDSLNLGVAGSLMMYELFRSRHP